MSDNNTTVEKDWKARYLELVQQQSEVSATTAETEKLLCRIIIRLTLATAGLDPVLDPHLTALRNAVRKGVKYELKDQLAAISEALIRADNPDLSESVEAGLLFRLIRRSGVDRCNADKLHKLSERLIADGDQATDAQIDSFLRLLSPSDNRTSTPGLLRRLFSAPAVTDEAITPHQQLLTLLQQLDWPAQLSLDIQRLELELSIRKDRGAWVQVLGALVELLFKSLGDVQLEIRNTRGFLEELTRRLVGIDEHVSSAKTLRQQSMAEGVTLDRMMKQQVSGIRENMGAATSLPQLRREIGQHLDAIEQHVDKFVVNERKRYQEAVQLEERLRKRLRELKDESHELRSRMIEAHRLAATDTVTGLPNRLAYEDRLEQEHARWKRFGEPLTLLVWDVDDFKRINDRYGHDAGDKALRIIGQSLQSGLRETDFVARFGGEEFVMLLPGSNTEDAKRVADSVRTKVKESGLHSLGNRVEVTISCGLSGFTEGDMPADVFSRADQALYTAKRAGKDRVVVL